MNTTSTPMTGENYPMIRITDLHKSFIMGSQELVLQKGIDLEIPRGQMVTFVEVCSVLHQSPPSPHHGPASTFQ